MTVNAARRIDDVTTQSDQRTFLAGEIQMHARRNKLKAGARGPMHTHEGAEHAYVLSGKVDVGGNVLSAGDYLYTEAGEIHALVALEDSVVFASTERAIRVIEDKAAA